MNQFRTRAAWWKLTLSQMKTYLSCSELLSDLVEGVCCVLCNVIRWAVLYRPRVAWWWMMLWWVIAAHIVMFPPCWPGNSTTARWQKTFLPLLRLFVRLNPASSKKINWCSTAATFSSRTLKHTWQHQKYTWVITIVKHSHYDYNTEICVFYTVLTICIKSGLVQDSLAHSYNANLWLFLNCVQMAPCWQVGPGKPWAVLDQQGWVLGLTQHVGLRLDTQEWVKNNSAVGLMLPKKWVKIKMLVWE